MSNTDVPEAIAKVMAPVVEPVPGVSITWRFVGGGEYSVVAEQSHVNYDDESWCINMPDGSLVRVMRAHVLYVQLRDVMIKPKAAKP